MQVKELKQLIKIIPYKKLNPSPTLKQPAQLKSLYFYLKNQELTSETMAAKHFFPDTDNHDLYFYRLKKRLEKQLINSLFYIDPTSGESDIQKAHHQCYKSLAAVNRLQSKGLHLAAAQQAKKALKLAIKYDFTLVVYDMSLYLQYYSGNIVGDLKAFHHYSTLTTKYLKNLQAEQRAQQYFLQVSVHFANQKTIDDQLLQQAESNIQELKNLLSTTPSNRLHLITYNLLVMVAEMKSEHHRIIETCNQALQFFATQPQSTASASFTFRFRKIPALLLTQKYEAARTVIQYCLQNSKPNTVNYNAACIYQAFLGFHQNHLPTVKKAIDNYYQNRKKTQPNIEEQFTILHAFYSFLNGDSDFSINEFLQNVPNYSKDKRGNNINILIAQILFLLKSGHFDAAEIRIDAIQSYAQRNLSKEADFRSNCFIKLLSTIPLGSFHQVRVAPRAKKYLQRLKSLPIQKAKQPFEVEIINYERLWEAIFQLLD